MLAISKLQHVIDKALDVVFPRYCIGCLSSILSTTPCLFICQNCFNSLELIQKPCCIRCGFPFYGYFINNQACPECKTLDPIFEQGRSLFRLKGIGKEIIHSFKYNNAQYLLKDIQTLLTQQPEIMHFLSNATFVPVPLHPIKEYTRGYNQSLLIAKLLQIITPNSLLLPALKRIKKTKSQAFLKKEDRLKNVKNAFALKKKIVISSNIRYIIIDDVFTTGSTLNACSAVLQEAGAQRIDVFTLGHG